jgi:AAA15 family ATPase/GTPase
MLVPVTLHGTTGGPEAVEFALDDEASGTKRLFAIAGPVLGALGSGGTLFVDEIDASMHTLLVQQLLEVIQDPEVNDCGAQFVMTTHDTRLQTPELLRPDQIWLTEKTSGGATELYSLDDFAEGPRADAAFANGYLAGRYGAVPVFGNLRRAFLKARRNAQC